MRSDESSGTPWRKRAVRRPLVGPGPFGDLKGLVYGLYVAAGTPPLDAIAGWARKDQRLTGAPGRDTVARIIGGADLPPSQADVIAVVTVLARAARADESHAARQARDLWLAAVTDAFRVPFGAVRVSSADPRRLGVHAAIAVPGAPGDRPPEYVLRDVDESGLRAKVKAAAERGGFVLLVGGSSVGKTRSAFEALAAVLPDWWLVHPAGPGEVAALAAAPAPRTAVWLDELQLYLDRDDALTGGTIRALLGSAHPVVIVGTLWPERYAAYTALPALGTVDQHARERELLNLAEVVRIGPEFSPVEQSRARAVAARDPRVAAALGTAGYGLTQTLAAAPQLVARWQGAESGAPYARAVITAALDAARLGVRAPLTAEFLRAAAPGYCTGRQQAEAPANWYEQAIAYATAKVSGAASILAPAGDGRMGQVSGYIPADYLLQYTAGSRRRAPLPAAAWDALVTHVRAPGDASRLAKQAEIRLLYRYAAALYRTAADDGGLAWLLAKQGDEEGLRARADAGDASAASVLGELLARRGDEEGLRVRADTGDWNAGLNLAGLLAERGDEEGLRVRADAGDGNAARTLADLLRARGDEDGLRARANMGDQYAAVRLTWLLEEPDGESSIDELDSFFEEQTEAIRLLSERGDLDGLRALADSGDWEAARTLADLLKAQGDADGLRARADADEFAAEGLASLLAMRGDADGLRARADRDDWRAARDLAWLLARRGDEDGLCALADAGNWYAASRLADLLAEWGDVDGLRARADAGDGSAASELAGLLAGRGDDGEAEPLLRMLAGEGSEQAVKLLCGLLFRQGKMKEADRLRRFGLNPDGSTASG